MAAVQPTTDTERFAQWVTVEKGLSENTISAYQSDLAQFAAFLDSRKTREADRRDIGAYSGKLLNDGLDPSSVARKLSTLRQFYRFLLLDGVITKDPTATIPSPKAWKKIPDFLALAEVEQLLDASRAISYSSHNNNATYLLRRDQAMLELLYASGLRVSELATARMSDLNLESRTLAICGKGEKTRIVPFRQSRSALS